MKAILVVSFGTSYEDTREKCIAAIERKVAAAFPEYEVRRAFTSQKVIDRVKNRDGLDIDNVDDACKRLAASQCTELIVQPTHIMHGFEYEKMVRMVEEHRHSFSCVKYGRPLLSLSWDYTELVDVIAEELKPREGEALVLMGHGTDHFANSAYAALDYAFYRRGYENIFVGTVEGWPGLAEVRELVRRTPCKKVRLAPLLIVAGDHAQNDMAGDEDSWKTAFQSNAYVTECVLKGLGEYEAIQRLFVDRVRMAIENPLQSV